MGKRKAEIEEPAKVVNTDIVYDVGKYRAGWNGGLPETPCGYGSRLDQTIDQRAWLQSTFAKWEIKSIADIGAGDLNWIKHMDLTGIDYRPFDLVVRDPSVTRFDLLQEVPPKVDCILLLWVLNHFEFDDCRKALQNVRASGAKYLIMTDRPKWHEEQPPEIQMQALDALLLEREGRPAEIDTAVRAVIVGTGPSLTADVIQQLQRTKLPLFGCNNTYQVLNLRALLACNPEWWDYYYPRDAQLRLATFGKWTWDRPTADKYGLAYIRGEWRDSLSTDPEVIHYGHSSGYQLLGLAYHHGVREMILCGYDLRYPVGYDGKKQIAGGDRHYFAEYPPELQHWTKFNIGPNGELNGLLDCYRTIDTRALDLRIINCSPGSALNFFENGRLEEWI